PRQSWRPPSLSDDSVCSFRPRAPPPFQVDAPVRTPTARNELWLPIAPGEEQGDRWKANVVEISCQAAPGEEERQNSQHKSHLRAILAGPPVPHERGDEGDGFQRVVDRLRRHW